MGSWIGWMEGGTKPEPLMLVAGVYQAAFSSDGTRILTASADNTAKLWDIASGKVIASFVHHDTVRCAMFSPDGAKILTASWDKTARLWDAAIPRDLARQVKESAGNIARTGSSVSMASSPALQLEARGLLDLTNKQTD